jgi:uncharacterized phiE125 gp8 family phage protein
VSWRRLPPPEGGAAAEAVSLVLLRAHLRVDPEFAEEDALHGTFLGAAIEHAETVCRRGLLPGTYDVVLDGFPSGVIELPHPPGAALEVERVTYVGAGGELQELDAAAYELIEEFDPAALLPAAGCAWPAHRVRPGAVRVRFRAEYSAERPLPRSVATALLLLVGHWSANREAVVTGTIVSTVPMGVDMLLWPHRLLRFA